jgi:membrane protein YqaA with SNARE-associated domain
MTDAMLVPAPAAPRPGPFKRLYAWVISWADSPYGSPALFVIAFLESSFFPIPPDVLQIALSVGRPKRSYWYATIAVLGSVLGGVLGWYIGHALWHSISEFFFEYVPGFTQDNFELVQRRYDEHAFWAIFGAAFTPIPYKVFTIASGVFEVALGTLMVASVLGRGGRFFLVATGVYFLGPQVKSLIERYFGLVTFALLALAIGGFAAIKLLL